MIYRCFPSSMMIVVDVTLTLLGLSKMSKSIIGGRLGRLENHVARITCNDRPEGTDEYIYPAALHSLNRHILMEAFHHHGRMICTVRNETGAGSTSPVRGLNRIAG